MPKLPSTPLLLNTNGYVPSATAVTHMAGGAEVNVQFGGSGVGTGETWTVTASLW
jgi:hypothetical protein